MIFFIVFLLSVSLCFILHCFCVNKDYHCQCVSPYVTETSRRDVEVSETRKSRELQGLGQRFGSCNVSVSSRSRRHRSRVLSQSRLRGSRARPWRYTTALGQFWCELILILCPSVCEQCC